jgi:hypothetical protein
VNAPFSLRKILRVLSKTTQRLSGLPDEAHVTLRRRGDNARRFLVERFHLCFCRESGRIASSGKKVIAEMEVESPEYIFSLAGRRGRLVELFFHAHRMSPYGEAIGFPASATDERGFSPSSS